jgi:[ribosomal protein S5]-alanine N-acetyltransferase
MQPPQRFETARLHLRPPTPDDARVLFQQYAQDAEVARYLTWKPHTDISETEAFLRRAISAWGDGSAFSWVVSRTQDDQLMGMVEIRIDRYKADIGYVLATAFWGRGYMTEAVAAVLGWAAKQEEIYRVWAVCDLDNPGSARVMEKVGMQREGVLRRWIMHPNLSDEPRDCFCYAWVK